ncbi:unnamed protein product, partial [Pylaiella littoralis]
NSDCTCLKEIVPCAPQRLPPVAYCSAVSSAWSSRISRYARHEHGRSRAFLHGLLLQLAPRALAVAVCSTTTSRPHQPSTRVVGRTPRGSGGIVSSLEIVFAFGGGDTCGYGR